jgi:hypothetical protein
VAIAKDNDGLGTAGRHGSVAGKSRQQELKGKPVRHQLGMRGIGNLESGNRNLEPWDSGFKIQDSGFKILDSRFWIQDSEDSGDSGFSFQVSFGLLSLASV